MKQKNILYTFTFIELIVVLSMIIFLVSIIIPALTKVKDQLMVAECSANLDELNFAYVCYSGDNNLLLPRSVDRGADGKYIMWHHLLVKGYWEQVKCPLAQSLHPNSLPNIASYSANHYVGDPLKYYSDPNTPSETCIAGDGSWREGGQFWTSAMNRRELPESIHDEKPNILYFDGHVDLNEDTYLLSGYAPEAYRFWNGN